MHIPSYYKNKDLDEDYQEVIKHLNDSSNPLDNRNQALDNIKKNIEAKSENMLH